jgi:uncharacterized RDD family membrane protein YckC
VARWRDVKKGETKPSNRDIDTKTKPSLKEGEIAPIPMRIKAFIVDMFMIMMPILYILTYVFLDGKDDYQGSTIAQMVGTMMYGFAVSIFLYKSGQTPGMKAYEIKVVQQDSDEKLGFIQAFWRYIAFLISGSLVVGLFIAFTRDDKRTFHDIISNSRLIVYPNDKSTQTKKS